MTLVLLVMTSVSVVYVLRGIDPEAAAESLKAREPLLRRAALREHRRRREGHQRRPRVGLSQLHHRRVAQPPSRSDAVLGLPDVPRVLADRKHGALRVRLRHLSHDQGLREPRRLLRVRVPDEPFRQRARRDRYVQEHSRRLAQPNRVPTPTSTTSWPRSTATTIVPAKDVTDYHTLIRRRARRPVPQRRSRPPARRQPGSPPVQVRVSVTRNRAPTQYVGMAKYDLYCRLDDPHRGSEKAGLHDQLSTRATFGLWMRLCLVIGLAVALSTYLSGVISMLVAGMLYLLRRSHQPTFRSIGQGNAPGGGPMEASGAAGQPPDRPRPAGGQHGRERLATTTDIGFRWFIRRVLDSSPTWTATI